MTSLPSNDPVAPDPEPFGYALGPSGGMFRRLARSLLFWVPRPVFAVGRSDLYLLRLQGSGFSLTLPGIPGTAVGFVTTRIVSAASARDAEAKAISSALREWRSNSWPPVPELAVYEASVLSRRVWFYPPAGFSLYDTPDEQ
jgi:hypothetical protein